MDRSAPRWPATPGSVALTRLSLPAGASRLLVVLHGHGDDPGILADRVAVVVGEVGDALGPSAVVAPTGPTRTQLGAPAWFPSAAGDEGPPLGAALDALEDTLDEAATAAGVTADDTVVLGSSQGAATALALAFRDRSRWRPAAMAGLAAWLPNEPDVSWAFDVAATPVLLVHGEDDEVVPLLQGRAATRALERHGRRVSLRVHAGGHATPPGPFTDAVRWLLAR